MKRRAAGVLAAALALSLGLVEAQNTPAGMVFLRKNAQGYEEYRCLKDSSLMVKIPAGTFTMGSSDGEDDERPAHQVYLDEYHMDKYEVTNRQYKRFCDATGRSYPDDPDWKGMSRYFTSYPSYPVVNVSWEDAKAYCDWAGKRLPTEAEWEKAARGTDLREYPWGSGVPTGSPCNFADRNTGYDWREKNTDDGFARTAPVGSFPAGASPYGCMDMAGNVWEWCNDWYRGDYSGSDSYNPIGPTSGSYRVYRGGSWYGNAAFLRCAFRCSGAPARRYSFLGFRCALPVRGYIGVTCQSVDEGLKETMGLRDTNGMLVSSVIGGTPADEAGLQAGDVIVSVNGVPTEGVEQFRKQIAGLAPGTTVLLTLVRKNETLTKIAKLAAYR